MLIEMNPQLNLESNSNAFKGINTMKNNTFSVYAHQNPYKYLVQEGNVRREYLDKEAIWSVEDVVRFLCPEKQVPAIIREFKQQSKEIANPLGIFRFSMDRPSDLTGLVVTELLEFCRSLPGKRASAFATLIEQHDTWIAERHDWVEKNTPLWERRGARYRQLRKSSKLSIASVAVEMGISNVELSRFERGKPVKRANMIESMLGIYLELAILKRDREQEDLMLLLKQARYPEDYGLEEESEEPGINFVSISGRRWA